MFTASFLILGVVFQQQAHGLDLLVAFGQKRAKLFGVLDLSNCRAFGLTCRGCGSVDGVGSERVLLFRAVALLAAEVCFLVVLDANLPVKKREYWSIEGCWIHART